MAFLAKHLVITGAVQGVGFRPFLYRLLAEMQIKGEIFNSGAGVELRIVVADKPQLERLIQRIVSEKPESSCLMGIDEHDDHRDTLPTALAIVQNSLSEVSTLCPKEVAMCSLCEQELQEPTSRFYQYPFISCAECGPRYGVLQALPFDRNSTTYRDFPRCNLCEADYQQPENRRFHAQTISCAQCGPLLSFVRKGESLKEGQKGASALGAAVKELKAGGVVAIKSMSGFHLCCRATSETAVALLRLLKRRPDKPLALMMLPRQLEHYVHYTSAELSALRGTEAPIVLLRKRVQLSAQTLAVDELAQGIAPFQSRLGVMLPANGLQHLLMTAMATPLVMTSANVSGDAIMVSNHEALQWLEQQQGVLPELQGLTDIGVLLHNCEIERGLDDSVVFLSGDVEGEARVHTLRLGRGKAQLSLPIPQGLPTHMTVLALGGDLKNAFCRVHQGRMLVSEYFGDLKNLSVLERQQSAIEAWRTTLFSASVDQIDIVAIDSHPNYISHKQGVRWAKDLGAHLQVVDHHHAHAVACMVEKNVPFTDNPVWALVCDGQGMGSEGLWGAELLAVKYDSCQRYGSLVEIPLLGGERAAAQPWRCALGLLGILNELNELKQPLKNWSALPCFAAVGETEWPVYQSMATVVGASVRASSAGRLFDGIYALVSGFAETVTFEGQAAMRLQAMAEYYDAEIHDAGTQKADAMQNECEAQAYPIDFQEGKVTRVNPAPMLHALLTDIQQSVSPEKMALRFHDWFVNSFVGLLLESHKSRLQKLAQSSAHAPAQTVLLTGGVFQNQWLLHRFKKVLKQQGWRVLVPEQLPMNDQGLALGQAAAALARHK